MNENKDKNGMVTFRCEKCKQEFSVPKDQLNGAIIYLSGCNDCDIIMPKRKNKEDIECELRKDEKEVIVMSMIR